MHKEKENDLLNMDPGQEDFIRLLREKAEETPVPLALEPSMMMARLEARTAKKKTSWLKVLSPVAMAVTACFALVLAGRSGGLDPTVPTVSDPAPVVEISSETVSDEISVPSSEVSSQMPEESSVPSLPSGEVSEPVSGTAGDDGPVEESSIPSADIDPVIPDEPDEEVTSDVQPGAPAEEAPEEITEPGMGGFTPIGINGYTPKSEGDNPYLFAYRAMQAAAAPDNAVNRYASRVLSAGISADGLQMSDEKSIICEGDGYFYVSRQSGREIAVVNALGEHNVFEVEFETPSFTGLTVGSTAITHCESLNGQLFVAGTITYTRGGDTARTVSAMSVYDLSDPVYPELTASGAQDGTMLGFMAQGDSVYLFSRYYPDAAAPDNYPEAYVPLYYDGGARLADADDIVISSCRTESYVVATSYSSKDPGVIRDSLVLQGGGKSYYLGQEGLYLFGESFKGGEIVTQISALLCRTGSIELTGEVSVPGVMNYSDSPNEYGGTLRILTNTYGESNSTGLYIFDRQLNLLGSMKDLVKDQILRSVRFERNVLYFSLYEDRSVTYGLDLLLPQELGEVYVAERSEETIRTISVTGGHTLRVSGSLSRDELTLIMKQGREQVDKVTVPLDGSYKSGSITIKSYDQGRYASLSYLDSGLQRQVVRLYALEDGKIRELAAYDTGIWGGSVRTYVQRSSFYIVSVGETSQYDLATGGLICRSQY